jgi:hypothetical protein
MTPFVRPLITFGVLTTAICMPVANEAFTPADQSICAVSIPPRTPRWPVAGSGWKAGGMG